MKRLKLTQTLLADEIRARRQNITTRIDPTNDFNEGYIQGLTRALSIATEAQNYYGLKNKEKN